MAEKTFIFPDNLARATLALLQEPFAETTIPDNAIVAETLLVKGDYTIEGHDGEYTGKVTMIAAGAEWILTRTGKDRETLGEEYRAVVEAGGVRASGRVFVYQDHDPAPPVLEHLVEVTEMEPSPKDIISN